MIKLEDLTLREKIGQLLMVRSSSLMFKINGNNWELRDREEVAEILRNNPYGSVFSAGYINMHTDNMAEKSEGRRCTIEEHKEWISFLNQNLRIPLLVGVDCENGTGGIFEDGTRTVGGFSVGAADSEDLSFRLNAAICTEVKASGANWRWYPIADLPSRFDNSLGRSYSSFPDRLVPLCGAAIKGSESAGVVSTLKHFPGEDSHEFRDSHMVTTSIISSFEEWEQTQGVIFKEIIANGVDSVMVGHQAFSAVDDEEINGKVIPATCSKKIVTDLLRERYGFKGVIITDGLGMGSLKAVGDVEERYVSMINAGNDVLLGVYPEDLDVVYNAVLKGRIPMERIDESCQRVLELKEKIGLFAEEKKIDLVEARQNTEKVSREIAEKSITLLYDRNELFPLKKENVKKVAIMCTSHDPDMLKKLDTMIEEFEKRGAEVTIMDKPTLDLHLDQVAETHDLILYVAYVGMHSPLGFPTLYGEQAHCYFTAFGYGKEKSVGISLGYPYLHYDVMQNAETFINAYSPAPTVQAAIVKAMYGEIGFDGVSPTDLEPKLRSFYC
jgi:beta-N-acetylhexosaminidase